MMDNTEEECEILIRGDDISPEVFDPIDSQWTESGSPPPVRPVTRRERFRSASGTRQQPEFPNESSGPGNDFAELEALLESQPKEKSQVHMRGQGGDDSVGVDDMSVEADDSQQQQPQAEQADEDEDGEEAVIAEVVQEEDAQEADVVLLDTTMGNGSSDKTEDSYEDSVDSDDQDNDSNYRSSDNSSHNSISGRDTTTVNFSSDKTDGSDDESKESVDEDSDGNYGTSDDSSESAVSESKDAPQRISGNKYQDSAGRWKFCEGCGETPCAFAHIGEEVFRHTSNQYAPGAVSNEQMRKTCYKVFTFMKYGHLGRGYRIEIPPCVLEEIRSRWPSDSYMGHRDT